jgi:hypothetical protein
MVMKETGRADAWRKKLKDCVDNTRVMQEE